MQLATLSLSLLPAQPPAFAAPLALPAAAAASSARRAAVAVAVTSLSAADGSRAARHPLKPARKRIRTRSVRAVNDKWQRVQPGAGVLGLVPGEDARPMSTTGVDGGEFGEEGGATTMVVAMDADGRAGDSNGPSAKKKTKTKAKTKTKLGRKARSGRARSAAARPLIAPPPDDVPSASNLRPESCPALVLNADFSPLSYMPLSLWPWQEVVKAVFLERVTVVATYDVGIRSPGMLFPLPSVISLKQYQPMAVKRPAFTRFNVFLRDGFACQYCGRRFATTDLTFDHVVPRCAGGRTNWTNVVTACVKCNHAKGRYSLSELKGFKLRRAPAPPTNVELQANARKFPPQYLHESWRDYIYWSQPMEEN